MKIDCKDIDYVLKQQEPELLEAFGAHAETCPACSEQLRIWNEISAGAADLRKSWESPELWPRIEQALVAESEAGESRWWRKLVYIPRQNWLTVAGAVALVVVSVALTWVFLRDFERVDVSQERMETQKRLLTEQALRSIETAETAYVESIEKLSRMLEPKIQQATSPLMMSYREKLMIIDAAIAECRANIERNRFNAHLRQGLLSIYQEKQRTLEELMKEGKNEQQ